MTEALSVGDAALREALEQDRKVLKMLEYSVWNALTRQCPICYGAEPPDWRESIIGEGHQRDCVLALRLVELSRLLADPPPQLDEHKDVLSRVAPTAPASNKSLTADGESGAVTADERTE